MPIWGCDSYNAVTWQPGRYPSPPRARIDDRPNLFDYVVRRRGAAGPPRFWGRYINSYSPTSTDRRLQGRAIARLSRDEVGYLHDHDCKVALVYNGIDPRYDSLHDHAAGRAKADDACAIAHGLGAPSHVRIYADLEGWEVGPMWIRGWCDGVAHSRYAGWGGIYGRVPGAGEAAWMVRRHPHRPFWSRSVGEASGTVPAELDGLMERASQPVPPRLGHRADTSFWQVVDRAIEAAPSDSGDLCIWANTPRRGCAREPTSFSPNPATGARLRTVVWQYALGCWRVNAADGNTALIDMDLTTDAGLAGMW